MRTFAWEVLRKLLKIQIIERLDQNINKGTAVLMTLRDSTIVICEKTVTVHESTSSRIWASAKNATICRGRSPRFAILNVRGLPNPKFQADDRIFLPQTARLLVFLAKLAKASRRFALLYHLHAKLKCCVASTMCSSATNVITSHPAPTPTVG